jgi:hypothetical protein
LGAKSKVLGGIQMPETNVGIENDKITEVFGTVSSPFVVISELIKNASDAEAKEVFIYIDTEKGEIVVQDDGKGFSEESINKVGIAYTSAKKRDGVLTNDNGATITGNKGLGLFSVFLLCNELEIETSSKIDYKSYSMIWKKNDTNLQYEVSNSSSSEEFGSKIILKNIDKRQLKFLANDDELKQFRQVTIKAYEKIKGIPKIIFVKDGKETPIDVTPIYQFNHQFEIYVDFSYDRKSNTVKMEYHDEMKNIHYENIKVNINQQIESLPNYLRSIYGLTNISLIPFNEYERELLNDDSISLPNFHGKWYVKNNRKTENMNELGPGVKIYLNNFALYNYLNPDNDWLSFGKISQTKKSNSFKPHNVFGYVSLPNFNELEENLKIANERGGFIEDLTYRKFKVVIYHIVLYAAVAMDITGRNSQPTKKSKPSAKNGVLPTSVMVDSTSYKDSTEQNYTIKVRPTEPILHPKSTDGQTDIKHIVHTNDEQIRTNHGSNISTDDHANSQQKSDTDYEKIDTIHTISSDNQETGNKLIASTENEQSGVDNEQLNEKDTKILKQKTKRIEEGQQFFLFELVRDDVSTSNITIAPEMNTTIVKDQLFTGDNLIGKHNILFSYIPEKLVETLTIEVKARKIIMNEEKNQNKFYQHTNIFIGNIYLDGISDLVNQLLPLNYSDYYLLYNLAARTILEGVVKDYIVYRKLNLCGNLKDNSLLTFSDLLKTLKISNDTDNENIKRIKTEIHARYNGWGALKDFLVSLKTKFNNQGYIELLNSYTHNPRLLNIDLALEIANDIILPLHDLRRLVKENNL